MEPLKKNRCHHHRQSGKRSRTPKKTCIIEHNCQRLKRQYCIKLKSKGEIVRRSSNPENLRRADMSAVTTHVETYSGNGMPLLQLLNKYR
jgi:hypothetical protein